MKATKGRKLVPKSAGSQPVRPVRSGGGSATRRRPARPAVAAAPALATVDPALFVPLSEGERADALRILTEDTRLAAMAKVARYRVIAAEPLVVKPPHPLWGRRSARVVIYDYASDRSVEAAVDLDAAAVVHLQIGATQPMLAREEEAAAVAIALADERVKRELTLGDQALAVLHTWSRREAELAYRRRCAAVLLGQPGARPSLVAVVDLVGTAVVEVVPAALW